MGRLLKKATYWIRKKKLRYDWRRNNKDNFTILGKISNEKFIDFVYNGGVQVGKNTYGQLNINYSGGENERIVIGANCSIAGSSNFLLGGEHDYKCMTTYPFGYKLFNMPNDVSTKGTIYVEDEVWIGDGVWIMSGVRLGKGSIIATGAVVNKDVPPYSIVGGCPAKVIKYRFEQEIIEKLMCVNLANCNIEIDLLQYLTKHITEENVDEIIYTLRS